AQFYENALGFERTVWSYPGALFLSSGGYHHHLGVNSWAAGAAPAGDGDARLLEWEVIVPSARDAEEALSRLGAAGHRADDGVVRDPWGTAVRIRA
ncbi:MAG TPA: VOC family protein, partial [Longimicrobium sp.]